MEQSSQWIVSRPDNLARKHYISFERMCLTGYMHSDFKQTRKNCHAWFKSNQWFWRCLLKQMVTRHYTTDKHPMITKAHTEPLTRVS